MTPSPQSVTARYVHRLLLRGINNEFEILSLTRQISVVDEVCVGVYYFILVKRTAFDLDKRDAAGATPAQALERALVKFGVTFR